jgi:hypothetical protein
MNESKMYEEITYYLFNILFTKMLLLFTYYYYIYLLLEYCGSTTIQYLCDLNGMTYT